jgi:hypothetical protein
MKGRMVSARQVLQMVLVCAAAGNAFPQSPESLDITRRMARAGAIDIAIERVNQSQPINRADPRWLEWELLRIELLVQRTRHSEVIQRAADLSRVAIPDGVARQVWLSAGRSALSMGRPVDARLWLLRYFLGSELGGKDYRETRLAVIDSYLDEKNVEDAYRSMLRFAQEFAPVTASEAERFVAQLLAFDRAQDAATFLPQLDKTSPAAAMLRLRAGLLSPEAGIAHARALLAKGMSPSALPLLADAASRSKDRALQIEVLERQLDAGGQLQPAIREERTATTWKAYNEIGQHTANRLQLLIGDEGAWLERAPGLAAKEPQLARSLYGHIASIARQDDVRARAQVQLIASLREAKLSLCALHLFADKKRFPVAALDARVRLLLGELAAESKRPAEAVRYWQGLNLPREASAQDHALRYLSVLVNAGMIDEALLVAQRLASASPPPAPVVFTRLLAIAQDALELWQVKAAEALFGMTLTHARGPERVESLLGLGRTRELLGEFRMAADAYLNAALLSNTPESDRESLRAREAAAINLAKAGMRDDARALYSWLASNAKEPQVREQAQRALRRY